MNTTESLRRLRAADPARSVTPPFTAEDLLTAVIRAEWSASPAATAAAAAPAPKSAPAATAPAGPLSQRRFRRPGVRRWATIGVAAAAILSTPAWWPGSPGGSSTALALTRDGEAVHLTVPRASIDAGALRAALQGTDLPAVVIETTSTCPDPGPDGLPAGSEVAPPAQNVGLWDPDAIHLTFYPDRMPPGSTLVFGVEPAAITLLLTDQVPACLPPMVQPGGG